MRLIDADALHIDFDRYAEYIRRLKKGRKLKTEIAILLDCKGAIDNAQTVDAVPVRHGRWIAHTMSEITGYDPALSGDDPVCTYSCSVCGEDCYVSDTGDDILSNYCPNCGADMRGEGDERNR